MVGPVIGSDAVVTEWVVPKMHFIRLFGASSDPGIEPETSQTETTQHQTNPTREETTTA